MSGLSRSARFPWHDGRPAHLPCGPGDMPPVVLLPGDPDRVAIAASVLENVRSLGRRREFAAARGTWGQTQVGICSSGIGGPSTEIAAVELANLGVTSIIRVGGMGAIDPDLPLGSFVIVEDASGGTGAARIYAPQDRPLAATPGIVAALERAATDLGLTFRRGRVRTTDSYYRGQERPLSPTDDAVPTRGMIAALSRAGIAGLDMECETLFAVGAALGIKTGAVLAVHGNRATDNWLEDYEPVQRTLIRLAATAATYLDHTGGTP